MSTAADAPRGSPRRSGGRSMRTFLMTWLWALVAVYVLVTLLMFLAQRSLIYPAAAIAPQIADQGLAELRAIVTEPDPGLRTTPSYHPPAGERGPLGGFFHGTGRATGQAFLQHT